MKITVLDKSYPEQLAVTIDGECNHMGDIVYNETIKWVEGYPETVEIEMCDNCNAVMHYTKLKVR